MCAAGETSRFIAVNVAPRLAFPTGKTRRAEVGAVGAFRGKRGVDGLGRHFRSVLKGLAVEIESDS